MIVEGGDMANPVVDLFNELSEVISESEVDTAQAFSILMKLAALGALYSGMSRADYLRAADTVYQIEAFIKADVKDLPMQ
jgi:hypothetical protein